MILLPFKNTNIISWYGFLLGSHDEIVLILCKMQTSLRPPLCKKLMLTPVTRNDSFDGLIRHSSPSRLPQTNKMDATTAIDAEEFTSPRIDTGDSLARSSPSPTSTETDEDTLHTCGCNGTIQNTWEKTHVVTVYLITLVLLFA
eukprot:809546_1